MNAIIDYLKLHGEQMDTDLARALELPLEQVRSGMQDLLAKGAVMMCFVTRYREGAEVQGWSCRLAGFVPPPAPGRRPRSAKS